LGPLPLCPTAHDLWRQLRQRGGELAHLTEQLIHQFHTCLFVTYRCHQRRALHGA